MPPHDELSTSASSKETARIEAFSDGVFAIAITLLILDIKVPHPSESSVSLGTRLLGQWPYYVAFLASFLTIGIMWINHHRLFTYIVRSSQALLLLNSLLLLGNVLWRYASKHLLGHNANLPEVREISKQYKFGPVFYWCSDDLEPDLNYRWIRVSRT